MFLQFKSYPGFGLRADELMNCCSSLFSCFTASRQFQCSKSDTAPNTGQLSILFLAARPLKGPFFNPYKFSPTTCTNVAGVNEPKTPDFWEMICFIVSLLSNFFLPAQSCMDLSWSLKHGVHSHMRYKANLFGLTSFAIQSIWSQLITGQFVLWAALLFQSIC